MVMTKKQMTKMKKVALTAGAVLAVSAGSSALAEEVVVADNNAPNSSVAVTEQTVPNTSSATVDDVPPAPSVDTPTEPKTEVVVPSTDVPDVPKENPVPSEDEKDESDKQKESEPSSKEKDDKEQSGDSKTAIELGIKKAAQNVAANDRVVNTAQQAVNQGVSQIGTKSEVTGQVVSNVSEKEPVVTDTGYTIVGTESDQVIVQNADGSKVRVAPEVVGATVNQDKTISVKTADGSAKTLPETPAKDNLWLTLIGTLLALAGIKLISKNDNVVLTKLDY